MTKEQDAPSHNVDRKQIIISTQANIHPTVEINVYGTGLLQVEDGVSIMQKSRIYVFDGAKITIRKNTKIGENVYIAAMCGIYIGEGCVISNTVNLHDYNHRDRNRDLVDEIASAAHVDTSGFDAAPIMLESGSILLDKTTVTAGVRIGENSKIEPNSVISQCIPRDTIALGAPAKAVRSFDGPLLCLDQRPKIKLAAFGDSILEHMQADVGTLYTPGSLPDIGTELSVASWRKAGFIRKILHHLQAEYGDTNFSLNNAAVGGSTSREVLEQIRKTEPERFDLVFVNCGTNDVWRQFQGRNEEAVLLDEFEVNLKEILRLLRERSRQVVFFSTTPVETPEYRGINDTLRAYNELAERICKDFRVVFFNSFELFKRKQKEIQSGSSNNQEALSLYVDGVHFSELGDSLITKEVLRLLEENRFMEKLRVLEHYPVDKSLEIYSEITSKWIR